jgi:glycosyltransferase involved in cell wall biosynthesis
MSVSVIVPIFNGSRFLAETIESVCRQTHPNWELILVDDGSTDSSREIAATLAASDSRIRLVCQQNQGGGAARARGAVESDPTREFLLFLDHDDMLVPDALESLLLSARSVPGAVGAHGRIREIGPNGEPTGDDPRGLPLGRRGVRGGRLAAWNDSEPTTLEVLVFANCIISFGSCLVSRRAFNEAGGVRPGMWPVDDHDLWLRLAGVGPIVYLPRPVLLYRQHGANESANDQRMQAACRSLQSGFLSYPGFTSAQRELVREGFRHSYRVKFEYARQRLRLGDLKGFAMNVARGVAQASRYRRAVRQARLSAG